MWHLAGKQISETQAAPHYLIVVGNPTPHSADLAAPGCRVSLGEIVEPVGLRLLASRRQFVNLPVR
jgi:hypothetical protein